MPPLKLLVCATEDVALPTLRRLHADHEIAHVLVRPPRTDDTTVLPESRQGQAMAETCRELGIAFSQPSQPGSPQVAETMTALAPDLGVLVAYGRGMPTPLLPVPRLGWVKIHLSLLPKHRGLHAARATLWKGEKNGGVTAMEVTDEPDAGPILDQLTLEISPAETYGSLLERLTPLVADLATTTLDRIANGKKTKKRTQSEKSASTAPRFGRRHLMAPWWQDSGVVFNRLRSLTPEPGMTTLVQRRRIQILWGEPTDWVQAPPVETGSFLGMRSGRIAVLCGGGTVFGIARLIDSEGIEMSAADYVQAQGLRVGAAFV